MGHTALNGLHCLLSNAYRWAFPGIIRPEHDINNVPSSSSRSKNAKSCTSTHPYMARYLLNWTKSVQTTIHISHKAIRSNLEGGGRSACVHVNHLKPTGHYMYRTVVTICTAQWSLYVPHNGHYMYRTVVTICTSSLTVNNSTFCPHSCIYVFCVDLRTNSHYFPIQR
jgi:hypothetical protein